MNPRLVTLHVSADGVKFKLWDKFQTPKERGGGDQIYCCTSINSSIYPYLVLEVNENFGGEQTSIDRVFLYSDEIISSPEYLTNGEKCDNFGTNGGNNHIVSGYNGMNNSSLSKSTMLEIHSEADDFPTIFYCDDHSLLPPRDTALEPRKMIDIKTRVETLDERIKTFMDHVQDKQLRFTPFHQGERKFNSINNLNCHQDNYRDVLYSYSNEMGKIRHDLMQEQSMVYHSGDQKVCNNEVHTYDNGILKSFDIRVGHHRRFLEQEIHICSLMLDVEKLVKLVLNNFMGEDSRSRTRDLTPTSPHLLSISNTRCKCDRMA